MKLETKQHLTRSSVSLAAFASLSLLGCVGEIEDGQSDELQLQSASVTSTTWNVCANRGRRCSFSGTQQVRYGVAGNFKIGTFTDGVTCAASSFATRVVWNAKCELATTTTTTTTPAPAVPKPPAPIATPQPVPPPVPAPTPAPVDPHAGHVMAGAVAGLAYDASKIPSGAVGSSSLLIRSTNERPAASDGTGSFRTECAFSHMNNDDPLVFPGQVGAAHLHAFFGNTSTNAFSTPALLRSASSSTCRGGIANRSAYWVPALIDTATNSPIKPARGSMYYKSGYGGVRPEAIQPFPEGLRMLAGDPKNVSEAQPHAYWGCLENYQGKPATIPNNCGVGNHVLLVVQFPQCWNGKDLDSSDHRSHMAYTVNGGCPATHPVAIPEITFNISYDHPAGGTSKWRLSSDMYDASISGGRSLHADWMDGWDPEIAKTFVRNCNNQAVDCHSHLLGDGREIFDQ